MIDVTIRISIANETLLRASYETLRRNIGAVYNTDDIAQQATEVIMFQHYWIMYFAATDGVVSFRDVGLSMFGVRDNHFAATFRR